MKNNFLFSLQFSLLLSVAGMSGCASSAADQGIGSSMPSMTQSVSAATLDTVERGVVIKSTIVIQSGSPSEAVRNFYKAMREKRFQDAMMMTNMKAAVQGLSLEESKDLAPDFEVLATLVPADLQITGEQISGEKASVFMKIPSDGAGGPTSDEVKLRKEGDAWVILSGDDKEESDSKKQGKAYFFNVRIDMHHQEVGFMFERIQKAQLVFSTDGKGFYGDRDVLVREGLLPVDINTSYSTGYIFNLVVSQDKKSYYVNAVPAVYGKSGKLSFYMESGGKGSSPKVKSSDNGGLPLKK
jgi:hypothetical protein